MARVTGRKLQHLRQRLFDKHPLCVLCLAKGRTAVATIRDHVVPLAEGGPDTEENTQAICVECHEVKTAEESKRGVSRGWGA